MKLASIGRAGQHQQRGAALVVALLISALVAVFAVRIANNYQLSIRRASNQILSDQATLYLFSAENIAKQLLMANVDDVDGNEYDHNSEPWGATYPPVPIGNGMLAAEQLVDLQGRFNLNSLIKAPAAPDPSQPNSKAYTAAQKMFIRLLQTFDEADTNIDVQTAQSIADAVIDWVDENNSPNGFDGAESTYYQDLDIPYRAANVAMKSVSELRLVKGIDARLYRLLEPHVTVLDESVQEININSASENILRALAWEGPDELEPLDASELETTSSANSSASSADDEESTGMSKESFLETSPWKELKEEKPSPRLAESLMEAKSDYFALTSHAKLGELTLPMRTVFKVESSDKVLVLSRSTGSL